MSIRKITDDLLFVGASDRRLALFESAYPVPEGVSYNAYLLRDEKNVLFDTVDKAVADTFLTATAEALDGADLDYVVVQHMEPDHWGRCLPAGRTPLSCATRRPSPC